jgi:hypothetical protein
MSSFLLSKGYKHDKPDPDADPAELVIYIDPSPYITGGYRFAVTCIYYVDPIKKVGVWSVVVELFEDGTSRQPDVPPELEEFLVRLGNAMQLAEFAPNTNSYDSVCKYEKSFVLDPVTVAEELKCLVQYLKDGTDRITYNTTAKQLEAYEKGARGRTLDLVERLKKDGVHATCKAGGPYCAVISVPHRHLQIVIKETLSARDSDELVRYDYLYSIRVTDVVEHVNIEELEQYVRSYAELRTAIHKLCSDTFF